MKQIKKAANAGLILGLVLFFQGPVKAQDMQMSTYCNPVNIDYTYMIYNAHRDISYRSGADPAVVEFRGEYYLFVTRSMGYWHSSDLLNWSFITPEKWYFEGSNAPAAYNFKDSLLYVTGNPSGSMSLLYTDDPKKGNWRAVPAILNDLQDPALFADDDGKWYLYWGSSNKFPVRAKTLDSSRRFRPSEKTWELFNLRPEEHGWERFGENHSDTVLGGYIEGPWMTKHEGTYYLQYAAPGTEFNIYGDGVYTSDSPLGPFKYAPNSPFSYKPGGFMNGAGHGSTVQGPGNRFWHFSSMAVNVNIGWERRIGMFPVFFDQDKLMYSNTTFGDYPHYAPAVPGRNGEFTGWMLLSYKKKVKASSQLDEFDPARLVDENVKTFWVAEQNDDRQWIEIDLGSPGKVHAVQVNYNDYLSDMYGKIPGLYHRYTVEGSADGQNWVLLVDRSRNFRDVPNDYVELEKPAEVRYIRYNNIHVPTPYLSVSDLRVFGLGQGKPPVRVKNLTVARGQDRRDALLSWDRQENAQGCQVLWGIAPDKLYNSWLVYDDNRLELKCLSAGQTYYFSVEAFNENGVGPKATAVKVD
jgi:hypothetical protein